MTDSARQFQIGWASRMDRFWLLTWTTYGSWLPGDRRRFVGKVLSEDGLKEIKNIPGIPYEEGESRLEDFAKSSMKSSTITLTKIDADDVLVQFQETASYRSDRLFSVAIMPTHIHVVLGVNGDPEPDKLLHVYKSYASRKLNKRKKREVWWTKSGSKRKLPDEPALIAGIRYVNNQQKPLALFIDVEFEH
ncbi:transposase [Rubinisphaera italica]|uniref:Transposase IS200 like protein n=1 Tax=Rubinisphaera italica TaxID=2527969 RepID=A0A5C5XNX5_9PLAN|nr:transposase [Rubinisphaera italica]TWT64428.1 Transposase IS200 like protein [Rubinisphaera italica]